MSARASMCQVLCPIERQQEELLAARLVTSEHFQDPHQLIEACLTLQLMFYNKRTSALAAN